VRTLLVVPVIDPELSTPCLDSIHPDLDLYVVDNCLLPLRWSRLGADVVRPTRNLGVARSWNMGVAHAITFGFDAVALISAAVRFGVDGGRDLAAVDPGKWGCTPPPAGWHTAILTTGFFDRVGVFDENFFPAYYEDIDMIRRAALAGIHLGGGDRTMDLTTTGPGHGVDALRHQHPGLATINYDALADYWEAKWGVPVAAATDTARGHITPFGRDVALSWWEPATIDELLARYRIVGR
jgi:hypothetical protein